MKLMCGFATVLASLIWSARGKVTPITDFGAIAGSDVANATAKANGEAIYKALKLAAPGDQVLVPAGQRFEFIPYATVVNISHVELRIDGCLAGYDPGDWNAYDEVWPRVGGTYRSLLGIRASRHLTISGEGAVDGRGHGWWIAYVFGKLPKKRPLNIDIDGSSDVTIKDITVLDSPRFNVFFGAFSSRIVVERITIICDWEAQSALADAAQRHARRHSLPFALPMFPFNTDGVDVAGSDVVIKDSTISNWDDVVAVKPADSIDDQGNPLATGCTRNVTVRNLTVYRGVGLSVGSVHPSLNKPCVEDVLFEDVDLYSPLKGPYVKPDFGNSECENLGIQDCSASISRVTYKKITLHGAIIPNPTFLKTHHFDTPPHWHATKADAYAKALRPTDLAAVERVTSDPTPMQFDCNSLNYFCMAWPIYIGTQQQLEPDGSGSGVWAPVEPRVTVRNITFQKVKTPPSAKVSGGIWPMAAGAIRCNASNPCTGLVFEDVDIQAVEFLRGRRYICDDTAAASGSVDSSTSPNASVCLQG